MTTATQGLASLRALAGRAILRGATGYPRREGDASVSLMAEIHVSWPLLASFEAQADGTLRRRCGLAPLLGLQWGFTGVVGAGLWVARAPRVLYGWRRRALLREAGSTRLPRAADLRPKTHKKKWFLTASLAFFRWRPGCPKRC